MKTFDILIPAQPVNNSAGEAYTVPPRALKLTESAGVWSCIAPPDSLPIQLTPEGAKSLCQKCANWASLAQHFPV